MDLKKILIPLIALIIYVNYSNYGKNDISKLNRKIVNIKANIEREHKINKKNYTKEYLLLNYDKLILNGTNVNYSKAMGVIQDEIYNSSQNLCTVKSIKWAQVPDKQKEYDKLRLFLRISCTPNNFFHFINKFANDDIIYKFENTRITRNIKNKMLNISLYLVSYRTNK